MAFRLKPEEDRSFEGEEEGKQCEGQIVLLGCQDPKYRTSKYLDARYWMLSTRCLVLGARY